MFLDVQMPELDGFEVVRARGAARMPHVIFVTAYDEFAVRAFETHALDYLVKPVNEARFAAALDRVRERMRFAEALELTRRIGDLLATHDRRGDARGDDSADGARRPCRRDDSSCRRRLASSCSMSTRSTGSRPTTTTRRSMRAGGGI